MPRTCTICIHPQAEAIKLGTLTKSAEAVGINRETARMWERNDLKNTLLSTVPVWPAYLPVVIFTRSPRRRIHVFMGRTVGSGHAGRKRGIVSSVHLGFSPNRANLPYLSASLS